MARNAPKLMQMLAQLIATPSVSSVSPAFDQGNRAVIDLLAGWVDDLGFRVEVQDLPDCPGKANLIATLGAGGDGLVLAGHTDTVPYDAGAWRHDPFRLSEAGGRLYGLGASDMKSFLALALEAARGYRPADLNRPLTLLATADEESSMCGAEALTALDQPLGRYAVIGEPTGLRPVRMHKGILMEAIVLTGRAGHSSDPRLGNSALEGMQALMAAIVDWRQELQRRYHNPAFDVPVPTLNLGHIHGGDNPNRICGRCELHIDLRPLPGMDTGELRRMLRRRLLPLAERRGLGLELRSLLTPVPAMETAAGSPIVRTAEALSGHACEAVAFATEGPFLNRLGLDTVILGPGDIAQAHQPDEYLGLDRIAPTLAILNGLIQRHCVAPDDAEPPPG